MRDPLFWLEAPCVMGILNVTPDSFSDGGRHLDVPAARQRLEAVAAQGAAVCDIGAESTRPGAEPVPEDEQLARLSGLLATLAERPSPLALSIDTTRAAVAAAAIDAGAVLVNDVTAGRDDPDMLPLVAERAAAVCLMHTRGTPRTMSRETDYGDVVSEVIDFLGARVGAAIEAGVAPGRILVDPGIGFAKRLEHNLALLAALPRLAALGYPVLVGVSRKSMFGELLGRALEERLAGSLAAALSAVEGGASVVRVHDVRETVDALRTRSAIEAARAA